MTANDAVEELLERARGLCREQEASKEELEANYSESFNLARENWTGEFIFLFLRVTAVCAGRSVPLFVVFRAGRFVQHGVVSSPYMLSGNLSEWSW